jgi:hypothetical protein
MSRLWENSENSDWVVKIAFCESLYFIYGYTSLPLPGWLLYHRQRRWRSSSGESHELGGSPCHGLPRPHIIPEAMRPAHAWVIFCCLRARWRIVLSVHFVSSRRNNSYELKFDKCNTSECWWILSAIQVLQFFNNRLLSTLRQKRVWVCSGRSLTLGPVLTRLCCTSIYSTSGVYRKE